jgi:hypothetical protein
VIKIILRKIVPVVLIAGLLLVPSMPVSSATAPSVVSQSPAKGSTAVSISVQPIVNFSKTMDPSTINNTNIQLMNGSTQVTASIVLSNGKRALITPVDPLNYNTSYYILVSTGVKDTQGNALAEDYGSASTSGFTTSAPKAPSISAQYPIKGAIKVSLDISPYVVFTKDMDYTTINATNIKLLQNGTPVIAGITLSGTRKAVITPVDPLIGNTIYYIVVSTSVKDTTGMALPSVYGSAASSSFTTAPAVPPAIVSVNPADNTVQVPFNIQPRITFSKSLDDSTVNTNNIQMMDNLTPVNITLTLYDYTKVIITPAQKLDFNKNYSIVLGTGIKDVWGNALATTTITHFTTDSATPPVLSAVYPANSTSGVSIKVQPCLIFSEALDPVTVNATNIKLLQGTTLIRASVALYGSKLVIMTPQSPLSPSTAYSIVLTTGIKDISGNAIATSSTNAFTTGAAVLPVAVSQNPVNGSTGISTDASIAIVFSKAMDKNTITSNNILLKSGSSTVKTSVELSGKYTAVVTPLYPLTPGTRYYVVATTAVKDSDGNALGAIYGSSSTSQFTTAASSLKVLTVYPADQSTGAAVNVQPEIVFSAKLDATIINTTNFNLLAGSSPVTATVSLLDDYAVQITPAAPLSLNTVYTVVVKAGVKDHNGQVLASQFSGDFTTINANTPPSVSYQYPLNNAIDVPLDVQICLVFSQDMDASTIKTTNISLLDGTTPINANVTVYDRNTVIITPSASLSLNKVYSLVIGTGVRDCSGNSMTQTTTSFTTVTN